MPVAGGGAFPSGANVGFGVIGGRGGGLNDIFSAEDFQIILLSLLKRAIFPSGSRFIQLTELSAGADPGLNIIRG